MRRPSAYPLLALARMMGAQASEAPQSVGDCYKFASKLYAHNVEANNSLRESMEKVNDRSTEQSRKARFFSFFALKLCQLGQGPIAAVLLLRTSLTTPPV